MRLSQLRISGSGGGDTEFDSYQDLLDGSIYLSLTWDSFRDTLKINVGNTTMIHDTENSFGSFDFTPGQVIESINLIDPLYIDVIDQCMVSVDIDDSGVTIIEASADGINWETVVNNQIHEFTNTGTQIKLRVTGGSTGVIRSWGVLYHLDPTVYGSGGGGGPTDELINPTGLGGPPGAGVPTFRRCYIDDSLGVISTGEGPDFMLNSEDDNSPDQQFIAYKVWAAVWNDVADFQKLADGEDLIAGKCYYDTEYGAKLCTEHCQKSIIGIASDTFGHGLGSNVPGNTLPIAVAGWVLAYVNPVVGYTYKSGDILTNDDNANLILMSRNLAQKYPERIVAIYKKPELDESFGTVKKQIKVNGRHWVKVKG